MKLEHLVQAYKLNHIEVKLKDKSIENERAGVITFADGMTASYLLDNEDIVVSIIMFFTPLPPTPADPHTNLNKIISHTTRMINIIQNTVMLLANIPQKECNMILEKLGMFDGSFKKRKTNKTSTK